MDFDTNTDIMENSATITAQIKALKAAAKAAKKQETLHRLIRQQQIKEVKELIDQYVADGTFESKKDFFVAMELHEMEDAS